MYNFKEELTDYQKEILNKLLPPLKKKKPIDILKSAVKVFKDSIENSKDKILYNNFKAIINNTLYFVLLEDSRFYFFDLYKAKYETLMQDYIEDRFDSVEKDYLEWYINEQEKILNDEFIFELLIDNNTQLELTQFVRDDFLDEFKISSKRKIEFLRLKLENISLKFTFESENKIKQTKILSEKIRKHLMFMNGICPRTHRKILSDEDFEQFINWNIEYYNNNFKLPVIINPIRQINTNKTYIQLAFRYLFKEFHPSKTYPSSLFDFYKASFKKYSNDKRSNFDRVSKNSVVENLMGLD